MIDIKELRKKADMPSPGGMATYKPTITNDELFEMLDRIDQKLDQLLDKDDQ